VETSAASDNFSCHTHPGQPRGEGHFKMQQQLLPQMLDFAVFYFCYCPLHLLLFKVSMLFLSNKWSAYQCPKSDSYTDNAPNVCVVCKSCVLAEIPARSGTSSE